MWLIHELSINNFIKVTHFLISWDFHLAVFLKIHELFNHEEVKKYWHGSITKQLKGLKYETLPKKTNHSSIHADAPWLHVQFLWVRIIICPKLCYVNEVLRLEAVDGSACRICCLVFITESNKRFISVPLLDVSFKVVWVLIF